MITKEDDIILNNAWQVEKLFSLKKELRKMDQVVPFKFLKLKLSTVGQRFKKAILACWLICNNTHPRSSMVVAAVDQRPDIPESLVFLHAS